ncbi:hypothetical protein V5O48_001068 [Marasmius crinis-equi]|uniref:Nephrocystin 3-like N-terminal domain-containing protein n=1 Tax=Marasmius crinis-equi TaxID=585013 RepID=A0ABR3G083_9AGAR
MEARPDGRRRRSTQIIHRRLSGAADGRVFNKHGTFDNSYVKNLDNSYTKTVQGSYNNTHTSNIGSYNTTQWNYVENFTHIEGIYDKDKGNGLAVLLDKAAMSALHNSEARHPAPNILDGTRGEIVKTLSVWVQDCSARKKKICWINGTVGTGKSALAQALSEKYDNSSLAATFFFWRNDPTRDKLDSFVATIAHQLASRVGAFRDLIDQTIRLSPQIFHARLEDQFKALIQEPCTRIEPAEWARLPRLVIIDGLDECTDKESQRRLLKMIRATIDILPLEYLIFSRPEQHITHTFGGMSFIQDTKQLSLQEFEVHSDLVLYLNRQFDRLRDQYWDALPNPQDWPGHYSIMLLARKATEQFLYLVTVIHFIEIGVPRSPLTPWERLDIILHEAVVSTPSPSSPFPDLDHLYLHILGSCINQDRKLQRVLQLIASPVDGRHTLQSPFRLRDSPLIGLRSALAIERLLGLSVGEVASLLSGLPSILSVPKDRAQDIRILHASFTDFLFDQNRSTDAYYIGEKLSTTDWLQKLVAHRLRILSRYISQTESTLNERFSNGIHDFDIGALNVWKYIHDNREYITITDEVSAALNDFNPHLYLDALLHWNYEISSGKAPEGYSVSHFARSVGAGGGYRDWRKYTIAVNFQMTMLYSVFHMMRELDAESRQIQRFINRCTSLFDGFYVAFPRDQGHESIRYPFLASCLSIARLRSKFPDQRPLTFLPVWVNTCWVGASFRILPAHPGEYDAPPARPEVKWWVGASEGQLLLQLLETFIRDADPAMSDRAMEILSSGKIENWAYSLAKLDWDKTWKMYRFHRPLHLYNRAIQAIQGKKVEDPIEDSDFEEQSDSESEGDFFPFHSFDRGFSPLGDASGEQLLPHRFTVPSPALVEPLTRPHTPDPAVTMLEKYSIMRTAASSSS